MNTVFAKGQAKVVRTFGSLGEFVDYGQKPSPNGTGLSSKNTDSYYRTWTGSKSYADAVALAFGGWVEGAKRVQKRRADIGKLVQGGGQAVEFRRTSPGALSMSRYLSGHPRPYSAIVPVEGKPKVVRILVNVCQSAAVTPDRIERRGAAVCSLVDALEANGRTCEITAVAGHGVATYYVPIKKEGARLNLPSVAFALAHPSMLRRVVFAAIEQETGKVWDALRFGYGMPTDVPHDDDVIYLGSRPGLGEDFRTDSGAAEWVRKVAAAQGVTLS